MTTQLEDLVPHVSGHLKSAPEGTVVNQMRRAARQFARDSMIWDKRLGSTDVTESSSTLSINIPSVRPADLPDGTEWTADFSLPAESSLFNLSLITLDEDVPREKFVKYDKVTSLLHLHPCLLTKDQELVVWGILQPSQTAESLPDFFVEAGIEAIAAYTIWEMMRMPDQVWSSSGDSWRFEKQYEQRLSEIKVSKARNETNDSITLDPIPFTG